MGQPPPLHPSFLSFDFAYIKECRSITPWVTNMGLQNAFVVAAFAGLAQVLSFLVFVKYGRGLREASRERYGVYVREMNAAGLFY